MVRVVFDSVAEKYDIMNDAMSLGIHRAWKRFTIAHSGVKPGDVVLDVAAGYGRHAHALAERGLEVTAADIDTSGLEDFKGNPRVDIVPVDLETDIWPFSGWGFDGIVVANYLHRPHFPHYISELVPGGVLIIDAFGEGNEKLGRPREPGSGGRRL